MSKKNLVIVGSTTAAGHMVDHLCDDVRDDFDVTHLDAVWHGQHTDTLNWGAQVTQIDRARMTVLPAGAGENQFQLFSTKLGGTAVFLGLNLPSHNAGLTTCHM